MGDGGVCKEEGGKEERQNQADCKPFLRMCSGWNCSSVRALHIYIQKMEQEVFSFVLYL